uniref:NADH-ubiquinone oxidoreductase chain 2 n=1 Tax=Orophyllus montanus TaxID=948394 RepID=A0A1Q1MP26_9ORTH|nr:NADH dehydrogenase subunit 2 [Orophyllus montanus]
MLNPSKCLFIMTLTLGTLISISSTSWLSVWVGLEINLLSFIPLIAQGKNSLSTEASLKYFLIQALASSILLFSFILMQLTTTMNLLVYQELFIFLLISSLLLKMGAAPFHFWFPGTMEGLDWFNNMLLMTWQKIAPLMLLSYLIKFNTFTSMIILCSIITGSLGGLNQTSLRKLMAYSSINHLGWMIGGMLVGENMWLIYFLIYTILSLSVVLIFHSFQISYISQNYMILAPHPSLKFFLYTLLLSLGGLPPFLGFAPKWLIIQTLMNANQIILISVMVITTLVTLFYYIRLTFSAFLLNPTNLKWNLINPYSKIPFMTTSMMTIISTTGLLFMMMIWSMS